MNPNRTTLPIRGNMSGIVFPPVTTGIAASLSSLIAQLDETQWLSPDLLRERQFKQLEAVTAHAAKESDHFKSRMDSAGLSAQDLATPDGFRRLPILRRRDIQLAGDSLHCKQLPAQHRPVAETRSSGSTGEPVVVRRTAMTQLFWLAMTIRDHLWHGRDFAERFTAIRAQINTYTVRDDWGPPVSILYDSGPFQAIPISTGLEQQWNWLAEFQPRSLLIYPSNLDGLTQFAKARGLSLPSLRHIRTIGETLRQPTREKVEAFFTTAKIADCYSSQECGNIAIQCPESSLYHICAENLLVEVLDDAGNQCAPGQTGRVVVTDMINFACPIIRYDIGDYAEVGPFCHCGRGLPTLTRILGRERNLIVMPDGTRHWPIVGTIKFTDVAPIQQFQFIQQDPDLIEVLLVSEKPVSAAQERQLVEIIHQCLGHPFTLKFTFFPDSIPRSRSGKFEEFICKLPQ